MTVYDLIYAYIKKTVFGSKFSFFFYYVCQNWKNCRSVAALTT